MSANNAKPRSKAARSPTANSAASTSSRPSRSSILRRIPVPNESDVPAPAQNEKALVPQKRPRLEKPIAIDEALRREGMGPRHYARKLRDFVEGVTAKEDPKLALEGIKEWGRHLESKKSASSTEPEPPVMVQLVHAVPRPSRGPQVDGESISGLRSQVDSAGVPKPDLGDQSAPETGNSKLEIPTASPAP